VVDAMTFSENPEGVLAAYCERMGVSFHPDSLSWEQREIRRWDNWSGWHERAQGSTSVEAADRRDPVLTGRQREAYEHCLPYYYELAAHAIPGTARYFGNAETTVG
jgi:hypothetical protein